MAVYKQDFGIIESLPTKMQLEKKEKIELSDLRTTYLKSSKYKDELMDYINTIISLYNTHKINIESYLNIKKMLSRVPEATLLVYKEILVKALLLEEKEQQDILTVLNTKYESVDKYTNIESIIELMIAMINDSKRIINISISEIKHSSMSDNEKINSLKLILEELNTNQENIYKNLITKKLIEKYENISNIPIINELLNSIVKNSNNEFKKQIYESIEDLMIRIKNVGINETAEYIKSRRVVYNKRNRNSN